jgi:ketosteroid isomerase-like protein
LTRSPPNTIRLAADEDTLGGNHHRVNGVHLTPVDATVTPVDTSPAVAPDPLAANKAVVATFFDRMSSGDVHGAFALVAGGATWFNLGSRRHGDAAALEPTIQRLFDTALQGPIRQQILIATAEEDRVAVVTEGHAMTLDGVAYDNMYHFLFRLAAGLITEVWEFNDTAHVNAVLLPAAVGTLRQPGK